jgi:hypothetical protein
MDTTDAFSGSASALPISAFTEQEKVLFLQLSRIEEELSQSTSDKDLTKAASSSFPELTAALESPANTRIFKLILLSLYARRHREALHWGYQYCDNPHLLLTISRDMSFYPTEEIAQLCESFTRNPLITNDLLIEAMVKTRIGEKQDAVVMALFEVMPDSLFTANLIQQTTVAWTSYKFKEVLYKAVLKRLVRQFPSYEGLPEEWALSLFLADSTYILQPDVNVNF